MIQNVPKRLFRKIISRFFIPDIQFSYSQFGEDIIIASLFYQLGIHKPTYLDIGANEPRFISNTYYFYEHGGGGVCVEPNPFLCKKIKKARPRDIVINEGIGVDDKETANFFLFPNYANGLSTFSEKEARHWEEVGMQGIGKIKPEKIIQMRLININTIFRDYCSVIPDLLSIDVEGLDFAILKSIDYEKYKPKIICAETLLYDDKQKGYKNQEISQFLQSKNYSIYADTRVNTIFCLNEFI